MWSGFTSTVVVVLVSVPLAVLLVLKKADDEQARVAAVLSVLLPVFFSSAFLAGFVLGDIPSAQPLRGGHRIRTLTLGCVDLLRHQPLAFPNAKITGVMISVVRISACEPLPVARISNAATHTLAQ